MIHHFKFRNSYSFLDETQVSFQVPKTVHESGLAHETEFGRFSTVMAVMGANGSGKTNLLKPLAFVRWFMRESFSWNPDDEIPFEPHFFSNGEESYIEVEFSANGEVWQYLLSFTRKRVIGEVLRLKTSSRFSTVFRRDGNKIVKQSKDFGFPSDIKLRSNASVISTAMQHNVALVRQLNVPSYSNVGSLGRAHLSIDRLKCATELFKNHKYIKDRMATLLRNWDLGLTDVVLQKVSVLDQKTGDTKEIDMAFGVHQRSEQTHQLSMLSESSGTQGAYVLLSNILPALATGGMAVIDELESDLHPHMLQPVLDLFFSKQTNPRKAQLLCTCHSSEILNILDKSQIVLVEKDENCRSEAYRLDQVEGIRADDNLYAKYMSGAYGGIPWMH